MTPSKNARASSAFWNCFPFSCLLTKGSKNQSQGPKSGEYDGWVTSWILSAARKSRVTAAVCALALSWWSSRPWTPVRWRRLHYAWKTLGKQWLTYQSVVTVFLSSSGMVPTWLNFGKKHAIVCLEALLFLLNFTGGFSSGKTHAADCCFVSGSYWYTHVLSPVTMSQTRGDRLRQIFLACGCTSPPYPASALHSSYGAPNGHNVSLRQGSRNASETSRWNLHDILYFSVCHFWVLLHQGLYPRDVFWGNGRCHSTTTVTVFQRSRSRHELSEPSENSGFGRRLISKTIPLAEGQSPLLDILSHGMKIAVRNQVNIFVTSITKLVYDVM